MESNLNIWIKHITEQDLPIFNHTARAISELTARETSSPAELAAAILQDANLSSRILRIANSPIYNRYGQPITTISKAVMYIGFGRVRDLSLSLAIIDSLLQQQTHDHALNLVARSFHAGVIARNMADYCQRYSEEEYFIAALLLHLGELAFWCLSGPSGDKIMEDIRRTQLPDSQAEHQILGTSFAQITRQLNYDWNLSKLLGDILEDTECNLPHSKLISSAHNIARLNLKETNPDLQLETIRLSDELKIKLESLNEIIDKSKPKAIEIATAFGATAIADRIAGKHVEKSEHPRAHTDNYPSNDPVLQLTSLRKLNLVINDKPNINDVIEATLEGLHHGTGLDRATFLLFNHTRKTWQHKFYYGCGNLAPGHKAPVDNPRIFDQITSIRSNLWLQPGDTLHTKIMPAINPGQPGAECFIGPIRLNGQTIGLIYADRRPSGRKLDDLTFEGFDHFCQQAQLAINFIYQDKRHMHQA